MRYEDPNETSKQDERPHAAKAMLRVMLSLKGLQYQKPWTWLPRSEETMCFGTLSGDTIELRYAEPDSFWLTVTLGVKTSTFELREDITRPVVCECFFDHHDMGPNEWQLYVEKIDAPTLELQPHLIAALGEVLTRTRSTPTFRKQLREASEATEKGMPDEEFKDANATALFRILQTYWRKSR